MRRPLRIEYPGELYCRHVRLLHKYAAHTLPVVDVLGDQGKWHREAIEEFSIVVLSYADYTGESSLLSVSDLRHFLPRVRSE